MIFSKNIYFLDIILCTKKIKLKKNLGFFRKKLLLLTNLALYEIFLFNNKHFTIDRILH